MKKISLIFLFAALAIVACKDDDGPTEVTAKMQMTVGNDGLGIGSTYTINDTPIQFTNIAFYVGDMTFSLSNGSIFANTGDNRYQLIRPGFSEYTFTVDRVEGEEDVKLSKIDFAIGVDAGTNAQSELDYTERVAGDPLGQQDPTMHWGWTGGYRFFNIDALADLNGDGVFNTQLTYHIGHNEFYEKVSLDTNIEIEGESQELILNFDIAKVLADIDFNTEQFSKTQPDNISIAQKIIDNYDAATSVEN